MKSLLSFVLGVLVGAGLLYGIDHRAHIARLFHFHEESIQAQVAGQWQGKVDLAGASVGFSMTIQSDGNSISGVVHAPQVGDLPCDQIKIDPLGNISFTVHFMDKTASFAGKFIPDTHSMAGNIDSSVGAGDWTLTQKQS